jgi:hypothetical protein
VFIARIVSFLRRDNQHSVAVAFNDDTKAHTVKLKLPGLRTGMILTDALSGTGYTVAGGTVTLKLRGTSAAILAPAPVSPHEVHP